MKYFKPTGTLNDISGGTLSSGLVPLDRLCGTAVEDTSVADQTIPAALTLIATLVPPTLAVGGLYLMELRGSWYRAGGVTNVNLSIQAAGTNLRLCRFPDHLLSTSISDQCSVLITAADVGWSTILQVERGTAWTGVSLYATPAAASVVLEAGRVVSMRRIERA